MIKVLIVEDSPVVQEFLAYIIRSDPAMQIVGIANDGEDAVEAVKKYKPDIITMDIFMPRMDGFEATRRIMEVQPTPIVIVSGSSRVKEVAFSFHAIEAGALAVVSRPQGIEDIAFEKNSHELVQTLKLMSEIKVVRRWPDLKKKIPIPPAQIIEIKQPVERIQVVAIGASTGGPQALQTILSALPGDFPVPILIVQHIVRGFAPGFAQWLAEASSFPVRLASDAEHIEPGKAYVAPDGVQMLVGASSRIKLVRGSNPNELCPSVSHLFRSVAETFGSGSIGVLLTGMGSDGARELKLMKDKHAVTIVQDKESSIVHGMPGEAIKLDAATYVLPLSKIASTLINLTRQPLQGGKS